MHVGYFHDGIIKEIHWVNRDFVNFNLGMKPYKLAEARILVQRQWRDPSAVEMTFTDVWRLNLDTVELIFESAARMEQSSSSVGKPRQLLVLTMEDSEIAFSKMRWRDASDWMGETVRFQSPS